MPVRAVALTLLVALVGLALATPARAAGLDLTCLETITRADPGTVNLAFPDEAARYWVAGAPLPPGSRLRIRGRFPHARYMSFNVYDPALRAVDALSDRELRPSRGSVNPFRPGGDRRARRRSYSAQVVPSAVPAPGAPRASNTLHAGGPVGYAFVIYRLYLPDADRDETGGVGLPRIAVETADGRDEPLELVDCTRASKPETTALNDAIADASPPAALDAIPYPGARAPVFKKFVNLPTSVADLLLSPEPLLPVREQLPGAIGDAGGEGGFLNNRDNAYLATVVNRAYGRVVEVTGVAPRVQRTRSGPRRTAVASRVDLRYFSMCQNEFFTQRFVACRTDEQTVLDGARRFRYVMSTAADRPRTATRACGVTWLPWGPMPEGVLIYRHMLPTPGYAASVQAATAGDEARTMGDVLPRIRYHADAAAFDRGGCRAGRR